MATIVLTAAGKAAGGLFGAAVGAYLGSYFDSAFIWPALFPETGRIRAFPGPRARNASRNSRPIARRSLSPDSTTGVPSGSS